MNEENKSSEMGVEPAAPTQLKRISAGVPEDSLTSLDALASEIEVSRSELVRVALSDFVTRHQGGEIKVEVDPKEGVKVAQPTGEKNKISPKPKKEGKTMAKKAKKGEAKKKGGKKKGGKKGGKKKKK
jgi:hypothetical protein